MTKLTANDVAIIKRRLLDGDHSSVITSEYAISRQTLSTIRNGKTWAEVDPATEYTNPETPMIPSYAKFSSEEAAIIKRRLLDGESALAVAREYNVGGYSIRNVVKSKTYKNVTAAGSYDGPKTKKVHLLNEKMVKDIKIKLMDGIPMTKIAHEYGCSQPTIDAIKQGKIWKSVSATAFDTTKTRKRAKLNTSAVKDIRTQYTNGATVGKLSKKFNVTAAAISFIVHRKTWKDI